MGTVSYSPYSDYSDIVYLLRDNSDLLVENRKIFIPQHLYLAPPPGVTPSEFEDVMFDTGKTRMIELPYGEKTMTTCLAVFIQYERVTDRRTDGRMD